MVYLDLFRVQIFVSPSRTMFGQRIHSKSPSLRFQDHRFQASITMFTKLPRMRMMRVGHMRCQQNLSSKRRRDGSSRYTTYCRIRQKLKNREQLHNIRHGQYTLYTIAVHPSMLYSSYGNHPVILTLSSDPERASNTRQRQSTNTRLRF